MVEGDGGTTFPVLFFDGGREMDMGDVEITPLMEYKPFQQMLSKMIGISQNQISIYLVYRNRSRSAASAEGRRKIPITGKVNFAAVCRQKGCSFLAVLKRSRKSRNRRDRMMMMMDGEGAESEFSPDPAPENLILLRRNPELNELNSQLKLQDLNGRLQSLMIREKFQTAMATVKGNANSPNDDYGSDTGLDSKSYFDSFPSIEDIHRANSTGMMMTITTTNETGKGVFCEECWNAKKNGAGTAAFHHCVNDAVISRFNNRVGPINPPGKPLP